MSRPKRQRYIRVEIMSCAHCKRLTVVLGDGHGGTRLSGHKCAGAWNYVSHFDVLVSEFKKDVQESCAAYGFLLGEGM